LAGTPVFELGRAQQQPPLGAPYEGHVVRKEPLHREQIVVLVVLALLTAAAWAQTLAQMGGMAEQPSMGGMPMGGIPGAEAGAADPGVRLLVYLAMWTTMMAAMMLPAAAPMILMFGTIHRSKRGREGAFVPTWVFVAGYLAVWVGFGACAWAAGDFGRGLTRAYPVLGDLGPRIAGLAMIGAALYQLTPLKQRCLAHCRSPLDFVLHHWRPGVGGAWRMGVDHGVYCVGCCWVLFVLLVVVGLASLPWMGLITLIVCAEKLLPRGRLITVAVAAVLLSLGVLTLARPDLLAPTMG
jgi:predicted metal-binding membrane protein